MELLEVLIRCGFFTLGSGGSFGVPRGVDAKGSQVSAVDLTGQAFFVEPLRRCNALWSRGGVDFDARGGFARLELSEKIEFADKIRDEFHDAP